jgi:hypothetical protein
MLGLRPALLIHRKSKLFRALVHSVHEDRARVTRGVTARMTETFASLTSRTSRAPTAYTLNV